MLSKKIILISTLTLCFSVIGCKEEAKEGANKFLI